MMTAVANGIFYQQRRYRKRLRRVITRSAMTTLELPMSLPTPANTTCDVYRAGNAPPASPNVAAVPCILTGIYMIGLERGEGDSDALKYTHRLLVDSPVDIRDDYSAGNIGGNQDTIYVPDQSGTAFSVIFTEIVDLGMPWQHKRIYLVRSLPSYPTSNL
jgi:hypothetical protein